jgi:hypothetical protein
MIDNTPHMTVSQLYRAARAMDDYGGSFAESIARAFFAADGDNKTRLLAAFGDLFVKFSVYEEAKEFNQGE